MTNWKTDQLMMRLLPKHIFQRLHVQDTTIWNTDQVVILLLPRHVFHSVLAQDSICDHLKYRSAFQTSSFHSAFACDATTWNNTDKFLETQGFISSRPCLWLYKSNNYHTSPMKCPLWMKDWNKWPSPWNMCLPWRHCLWYLIQVFLMRLIKSYSSK